MTTLTGLALEEHQLLQLVGAVTGSMEQKSEQLARAGVFARYREVHRQYAALAQLGEVEALRRAAFLQWISTIEPEMFTGVAELDPAAKTSVIGLLEQMCRVGDIDPQLHWMLPYYTWIAEWWFDFGQAPALRSFCETNRPVHLVALPSDFEFENRGQLAAYWASIRRGQCRA